VTLEDFLKAVTADPRYRGLTLPDDIGRVIIDRNERTGCVFKLLFEPRRYEAGTRERDRIGVAKTGVAKTE
jgi:hypothetical protein